MHTTIEEDAWYEWPVYNAVNKILNLQVREGMPPTLILAEYPKEPPQPAANSGVHSSFK